VIAPQQLVEQTTRHQVYLEGLKSGEIKKVARFLRDLEKEVLTRLAGKDVTGYTRGRLERLITAIRNDVAGVMGDYTDSIRQASLDLGLYEAGFEVRSLGQVGLNAEFVIPAAVVVRRAVLNNPLTARGPQGGLLMQGFLDTLSESAQNRVAGAIRLGYAQGLTTPQIATSVRETAFMQVEREAVAVTRTALQHAATQSREETWKANADIVKRVRWVSTLDSKTSDFCKSMDGRVFKIDEGPRPPGHYNCRSTTVAVLDERYAFLDEGGTRFARDAEGKATWVPANETYYGWLKRQPAEFQDSVIGPARGALLRNGGLSSERFAELSLNKTFKPRTLAEMRELEPVAFSRANL
jgi:SPP1 gp7 family putative phage head morphogenesis protein